MTVTRWHLLQVGSCRHPEMMARRGGHMCPVDFPALVGLILHADFGPILFDTGYHRRFFAATDPFPEWLYRLATPVQYADADSLEAQLARFNLSAGDIRGVFVSHFHGDHVAGLRDFGAARIFCACAGLDRTRQGSRFSRVRQGLLSALTPDNIDARATYLETLPVTPLDLRPFTEGADLLGDGSLIAVELPGHCPGHWGLLVRPAGGPNAFFIGDAAWSLAAITDNVPPPALTTALLGETRAYRQTLTALNAVAKNADVEIIPSHCPVTAAKWVGHE
ncbi:hypothetical protein AEAC466_06025 [Asticcacaulis sp. AC466]|uniref:MBL fold metallo-hydrolase n=1 Tax=Asticcacaulis sp. AC466 TaxID=1282362 RepID=UPI0003C3C7FD|nr:MBL fold metallo-hydrolase [Asticcacaulis sp. AC466]ESQ85268.1 hypothetical protein AEAC466_06025 [Asticcacaulis sp. AC466]